jgi:hypothetical protein
MRKVLPFAAFVVIFNHYISQLVSAEEQRFSIPSLSISNSQPKQGDTLEILCIVNTWQQEDVLQIIKPRASTIHPLGSLDSSTLIKHIISNNSDFDPELVMNERYSFSGRPDGNGFKAQITITDVQPMDSGTFLCSSLLADKTFVSRVNSTEYDIFIKGPIRMVELNSPPKRLNYGYSLNRDVNETEVFLVSDVSPLHLEAGKEVEIECQVILDNKPDMPIVKAFLDNQEITSLARSDIPLLVTELHPGHLSDGFTYMFYFWKMTPSLKEYGKNITCQAQLPNIWTDTVTTHRLLHVTGSPEEGMCDPSYVNAPVGTVNVNLTCSALANEEFDLSISWFGPGDIGKIDEKQNKDYTISDQRKEIKVTTTLTIGNVTELGNYSVVWSNQNGKTEAVVEIGMIATDSASSRWMVSLNIFMMGPVFAHLCKKLF